ncbi:DegV family protein [Lactobacillus delbrueckii]|uniref:DegV family protein n=1 Tax=Lactobacillus delbrueckii TaxID=1584 RepID=UPI003A88CB30
MPIKIVTDSGANMTAGNLGSCQLEVVALSLIQGDKTWLDDASFDQAEFNQRAKDGIAASSSCPSISAWLDAYAGGSEIYVVTISSVLSGSYNSAVQAAKIYQEEYPDALIHVFDSKSAGPAQFLAAEKIAELKEKGMQFPDLVEAVSDYLENHVRLFFALKSMTNLANNGRVKIDHADNFDSAAELHDLIRKKRPEARVDLGTCRALCSFYAEAGGLMIGVEI